MKDLTFTGANLDNKVIIRIDAINVENGSQVCVVETYGLNDRRPTTVDKKAEQALSNFKKINYPLQAFMTAAKTHELKLTISNTDGTDEKVLVAAPSAP